MWAERAGATPWHRGHIVERYGLFTIIMLGESILATLTAFSPAFEDTEHGATLLLLAAAALIIVFGMWWLYFEPSEELLDSTKSAFRWGYGHSLIFASAAAVGAGLQVAVDFDTEHTEIGGVLAASATAVPVAVHLLCLSVLHVKLHAEQPVMRLAFRVTIVLVLLSVFTPAPIHLIAILMAGLVTLSVVSGHRTRTSEVDHRQIDGLAPH